jgi:hypothetical protein
MTGNRRGRGVALGAVLAGVLLLGGCQDGQMREYTSPDGQFKVLFPGKPKEETQLGIGGLMKKVSVSRRDGAYVVTAQEVKIAPDAAPAVLEDRLDGVRNGAVSNIRGKLLREEKITLAGRYPGRDIVAEMPEQVGLLRDRLYLVGDRLYQVMVMGRREWVESPDAQRFLDSFTLTR